MIFGHIFFYRSPGGGGALIAAGEFEAGATVFTLPSGVDPWGVVRHSETPNCAFIGSSLVALSRIGLGQQITCHCPGEKRALAHAVLNSF